MDMLLIVSGSVFLVMLFMIWGVYAYLQNKQKANDWGIRAKGQSLAQAIAQKEQKTNTLKDQFVQVLERLGKVQKPQEQENVSHLRVGLVTAGYRSKKAPAVFMGARLFVAVLLGLGFLIFGTDVTQGMSSMALPGFLIGAMMVGYYLPQVWLNMAISGRQQKITDGFPDALDLMVVCVEAGLGLDQALARVGVEVKSGHPQLGDEFNLLNLELRAGLSREQALRNLVSRTDLEDIRTLVALLIQTDRFGTSIGTALRVHSDSMRMKRRLKAEEKAAQLPVKLMVPLILFIFPSLMVVIMGPGAISLMRNLLPAMGGS